MKRREGPHSRATSTDDAPDWWIQAYNDCLREGIGVIMLRGNEEVPVKAVRVAPENYKTFGRELVHLSFERELVHRRRLAEDAQ